MADFTFKVWKDYYDIGVRLCKKNEITLEPGLTILVGCNGTGKTTMLHNIKEAAREQDVPCYFFDNLASGGSGSIADLLYNQDYAGGAFMLSSSEGEGIRFNLFRVANGLGEFLSKGETPETKNRRRWMFLSPDEGEKDPEPVCDARILLLDAVDSGFSVDNVVDLKDMLRNTLQAAEKAGIQLYIVIPANEYELADGERCLDVTSGEYIAFADYPDYKSFIMKSRAAKNKRIDRQVAHAEKMEKKRIATMQSIIARVLERKPSPRTRFHDEIHDIRDACDIKGIETTKQEIEDMVKEYRATHGKGNENEG